MKNKRAISWEKNICREQITQIREDTQLKKLNN